MKRRHACTKATAICSLLVLSAPSPAAAPIPDFSGVWSHPFLTGFEPQIGRAHV